MLLVCVAAFDSVCFVLITAYCVVFVLLCFNCLCFFWFCYLWFSLNCWWFCWWLLCYANSVAIMIIVWTVWVGLFICMVVWWIDCRLFAAIVCVFVFVVVRDCLVLSLLCCWLCVVVSFVIWLGLISLCLLGLLLCVVNVFGCLLLVCLTFSCLNLLCWFVDLCFDVLLFIVFYVWLAICLCFALVVLRYLVVDWLMLVCGY